MRLFSTLLIAFILTIAYAEAQVKADSSTLVTVGTTETFHSTILNEDRTIYISLPEGYDTSKDAYNVMYLPDPEWNFYHVYGTVWYLAMSGTMPKTIIVSIKNTERTRDLTPTSVPGAGGGGGADNFISFMEKELMPYIEKTYRTTQERMYVGASLGGLLGTYILRTRPHLFDSYLIVSPAMQWDNGKELGLLEEFLKKTPELDKSVFVSVADEKGMRVEELINTFKQHAPKKFRWKFIAYPEEQHSTTGSKSTFDGLRFTYSGYNGQIEFHPMNGILLKDQPITVQCFGQHTLMRYTTDGTEPTEASPHTEPEIKLTDPGLLTIKILSNGGKYDKKLVGHFKQGNTLPASTQPKQAQAGGFQYAYYKGSWNTLPDFKKLKPVQTVRLSKDFDSSNDDYACLVRGFVEIKEPGYYIFAYAPESASKLYVGDQLLIDFDGIQGQKFQSYVVPLEKGFYPVRLEYLKKKGSQDINLMYLTPGSQGPVPIPLELQYSR